jgi:tetratricopeptide (TPR) repeat protein
MGWPEAMMAGGGLYIAYSFGSKALLARHHRSGMRLTKRGHFAEAIPHFERSLAFFEQRAWVDRWRALTMLSSARMSYREMALVNVAFCHAQVGDGRRAESAYREALARFPDSVMAGAALRLMEAARNAPA